MDNVQRNIKMRFIQVFITGLITIQSSAREPGGILRQAMDRRELQQHLSQSLENRDASRKLKGKKDGGKRSGKSKGMERKRQKGGKRGNIFEPSDSSSLKGGKRGNGKKRKREKNTRSPSPQPSSEPLSPTLSPVTESTTSPTIPVPVSLVGPTRSPSTSDGRFNLEILNMGTDTRFDSIIEEAAKRWEMIINDDLPNTPRNQTNPDFDLFGNRFSGTRVNVDVDDVLIGYDIRDIDGLGGTLGEALPTAFFLEDGMFRAVAGAIYFDGADMESFEADESMLIAIHEIGHVFGVGPVWTRFCGVACTTDGDPSYTCPQAAAEYRRLQVPNGTSAIQIDAGAGACAHWADTSFPVPSWTEAMTPTFRAGTQRVLSSVTVGALDDLEGYGRLNYSAADIPPSDFSIRNDNGPRPLYVGNRTFVLSEGSDHTVRIQYLDD